MAKLTSPMTMKQPLHQFNNSALAQQAFTHKSLGRQPHNERLEWLGDALLGCEISRLLYQRFPALSEGGLSVVRTALVNTQTLADLARAYQLDQHYQLGSSFRHSKKESDKLLAGLFEAYLAAIHLDGGNLPQLLATLYTDRIAQLQEQVNRDGIDSLRDAKTRLQEWLQKNKRPLPTYRLISEAVDTNNQPTFTAECNIGTTLTQTGTGNTRASAEQHAAAACLTTLQK